MSLRIMLAGAEGQLGRSIVARAAGRAEVHASDRAALDVADGKAVIAAARRIAPDVLVNAAAYTAVDRAESEPGAAFAVNRDGAANLAAAAAETGAVLIHVSTDYVFPGDAPGPLAEDAPTGPPGVYGRSKLAGEEAVRAATARHVILRTAWLYAPFGHNFMLTMLRLGRERDEIRVVDDQRGCPTAAGDLAGAVLTVAERLAAGAGGFGTFHCTNAGETTWHGFATAILDRAAAATGRRPRVVPIRTEDYPTPAARPQNSVLDCRRLAAVHGVALRDWREALDETLTEALRSGA